MSKSLRVDKHINVKSSAEVSEQFYPNAPAPCLTALAPLPQLLSDAVLMEAGPGAEGSGANTPDPTHRLHSKSLIYNHSISF